MPEIVYFTMERNGKGPKNVPDTMILPIRSDSNYFLRSALLKLMFLLICNLYERKTQLQNLSDEQNKLTHLGISKFEGNDGGKTLMLVHVQSFSVVRMADLGDADAQYLQPC